MWWAKGADIQGWAVGTARSPGLWVHLSTKEEPLMLYSSCCCCLVSKICLTLCDPLDCSLPGSSVYGFLQGRILEWVASPLARVQFSSVAQSCTTLRPHELQHTRPPCPSPTPGVCSNSCPSSRWCHPAILSSVIPFSSCPQSLPASGSFPMSQHFAWGGQSIGVALVRWQ